MFSQSIMVNYLLIGLLPLLTFVLVDLFASIKTAIIVASLTAVLEIALEYLLTGEVEYVSILGAGLLIAMGAISIRTENKTFFKLQPALFSFIICIYFTVLQLSEKTLIERFLPVLERIIPSLSGADWMADQLNLAVNLSIVAIFIDGLIVGYTALKCNNWWWLAANALALYVVTFIFALAAVIWQLSI